MKSRIGKRGPSVFCIRKLRNGIVFFLGVFACANVIQAEGVWKDITFWVSKGHTVISRKCNRVVDEGKDLIESALKQGTEYQYKIAQCTLDGGAEVDSNTASRIPRKVVVLVRGYGPPDPNYWEKMTMFLQNDGYEVWDVTNTLDGHLSVFENAVLLKGYIAKKVSSISHQAEVPQRLSIVTHSMGGQITREYLAFDKPQIPVDCVIMLSPTLCGSWVGEWALAKKMNTCFGSYKWDSTYDVSVLGSLFFNLTHRYLPRKNSATKFFSIAGTDSSGILEPFSKTIESSIDSLLFNEGGGTPAEKAHDGMVTRSSSWGEIGRAEVKYVNRVAQYANVIGFDGKFYTNNNHLDIISDSNVYVTLVKPILDNVTQKNTCLGRQMNNLMDLTTEGTSSTVPYSMVAACGGVLSNGFSASFSVSINSTSEARFSISTSTNAVFFTLRSPDGDCITPSIANGNSNIQYKELVGLQCCSVSNPAVGQWVMTVSCGDVGTNSIDYTALVYEKSSLAFGVACSSAFICTNAQITILGKLINVDTGVIKATVEGTVYSPDGSKNIIVLLDDGLHGDGEANDGIYGIHFSATQQVGNYGINLRAIGMGETGAIFEREGLGQLTFTAFSPIAEFSDVYVDYGVDLAPTNGLIDEFIVEVNVNVKEAGDFSVVGVLTGTNGVGITSTTTKFMATETGMQTILLRFDASAIYDSGELGGFDLTDLLLLGSDSNCAVLDVRTNAYATAGYDYFQFERMDKDSDGLSDLQEMGIGTDIDTKDSDFDQMDDKWEFDHGLDPLVDDSTFDVDHDGMMNFEEYLAGTDPQDNKSSLSIACFDGGIVSETNNCLILVFRSVPGKKYVIQVSETLTGDWKQLGEIITALGSESQILIKKNDAQQCAFYRVLLVNDS